MTDDSAREIVGLVLATALAKAGVEVPAPRTDSMGRGIIAYWPSAKWSEGA
jgi:hypothetical protein